MTAAVVPYVHSPTLQLPVPLLGPVTLGVFGLLVAVGIVLGTRLAKRRARSCGLAERDVDRLITWTVVCGIAGAHLVSVLGYYPQRVAEDPWLLVRVFDGISSVGGFFGGAAAFVWLTRRARSRWALADALTYGLLAGFTIGRLGCALVHDHPGALLDPTHPLAVGPWPDGAYRYDLGLIELMGLGGLCLFVYTRRWHRAGALTLSVAGIYCLGRFGLDVLRADDLRHAGLTTAQWATGLVCAALTAGLLRRLVPGTGS